MSEQIPAPGAFKPKKSVALSGTAAGNTALCTVGRSGNDLHYRGYDILDFANTAEFEEIAYLLVHGKLPNKAELAGYKAKLKSLRGIPAAVKAAKWRQACSKPARVRRARRLSSSEGSGRKTPATLPEAPWAGALARSMRSIFQPRAARRSAALLPARPAPMTIACWFMAGPRAALTRAASAGRGSRRECSPSR